MNTKNILIEYLKNKHGQIVGCVAATGKGMVGWSKCNSKDSFDKSMALTIAFGRAAKNSKTEIPFTVRPYFDKMVERAGRYFKN